MNCLRFTTRTGLVVLVAVLIVGGMMPAIAGAAQEEMGLFDPFALDAMISASVGSAANVPAAVLPVPSIVPADEPPTTLRTQKLLVPQHPRLFTPFRPEFPYYY
jgi:hypothetical protein